jgi:hypothetical protein
MVKMRATSYILCTYCADAVGWRRNASTLMGFMMVDDCVRFTFGGVTYWCGKKKRRTIFKTKFKHFKNLKTPTRHY